MSLRIYNTLSRALEDFSPLEPGHVVAGNRVRMQRQITIRPDTDWQSHLTNFQKALCWFLAGWKARQYGYTSQPVTPAQNVPIGGHNLAGPHFVHSRQTLADSVVSRSETER